MENEQLKEKLRFIEDELEKLKASIQPPAKKFWLSAALNRLNKFISTYKPLLTFVGAILTLLFVQAYFNISPFESYSNASRTSNLSEFYRKLGDSLFYDRNFQEAEAAYQSALKLQPNNSAAVYGLAKAQVFTPSEGAKYSYAATENKLDYFIKQFPDDADVHLLKCFNNQGRDDEKAIEECEAARDLNNSYSAYIQLGYICDTKRDFKCAAENYKKAVELNPKSYEANNNLGEAEFLRLNLDEAKKFLENANKLSDGLNTWITLGEVYRYTGDMEEAIRFHKHAVSKAAEKDAEKEMFAGGEWLVYYLPYGKGDSEIIKNYDLVYDMENKKAIAHYALAIDYAMQRDFEAASREFENAVQNDKENYYGNHFANRCLSAAKVLNVSNDTKRWFREFSDKVCLDNEMCNEAATAFR